MAKKKTETLTCTRCGETMRMAEFYKGASHLYRSNNSRLHICKKCVNETYQILLVKYSGSSIDSFRHLCMVLDIYFDEQLYMQCVPKGNGLVGEYFTKVNNKKDFRDMTGLDNSINDKTVNQNVSVEDGIISQELCDFWGEGYSVKEYIRLESKYKTYSEHYPNKRLQEQEIIKQLCELEIMKENCRMNGDRNGYDKICTQIRKTMDDLRILPKQSVDENEQLTVGAIIKMIEYNEPIPDKHEEFNDINGIEELIEKYFVKPFKRVFGLANKEFGDDNE